MGEGLAVVNVSPHLHAAAAMRILDSSVIYKLGTFHLDYSLPWELQWEGFLANQREGLLSCGGGLDTFEVK